MTDLPSDLSSDSDRPESGAASSPTAAADSGAASAYRVLARKYRPARLADLIGQDALVRTLTNAIEAGRVPQAFVLTGVRGVGKTTTARIIARALNCVGPDGDGGPTPQPCGVCEHCQAIAQDRHVDVIEMDAASRTGINDVREIIEGVRYRPLSARRKVYIIDEVHMLSTQAFNGLLKTLEEPPEHVVFIFATTEIRKVPVTVLSRCMRFDLRRVEQEELARHFERLAGREGVAMEAEATAMLARAADGSVRDGLSLMDQAIALSGERVDAATVKQMLGLADRTRIYDLYDALMRGAAAEAIDHLGDLYAGGADPAIVIQDLLEVTHTLTRLKLVPESPGDGGLPEAERTRGREMAASLGAGQLARNWQLLLKGLGEVQQAPQARQAAEMVLLRLVFASELPSPGDLVRRLQGEDGGGSGNSTGAGIAQGSAGEAPRAPRPATATTPSASMPPDGTPAGGTPIASAAPAATLRGAAQPAVVRGAPGPAAQAQHAPRIEAAPPPTSSTPLPQSLEDVVKLCDDNRELLLAAQLRNEVRPVRFEPGRIEINTLDSAPRDLAGRLSTLLNQWTGRRWVVTLSREGGGDTIVERERAADEARRQEILRSPFARAVLEVFPGARLVGYRDGEAPGAPDGAGAAYAGEDALPDEGLLADEAREDDVPDGGGPLDLTPWDDGAPPPGDDDFPR